MLPSVVVCIKVGTAYGPEYVNRLARAVALHVTRSHHFLCLTDSPQGLECDSAAINAPFSNWWAKLVLFKPHEALVGRRVVFLDLDTIILDNIDFLFDYTGDFAILQDFYYPRKWGSAIMSIAPGFGRQVWSEFADNFAAYIRNMWGDQDLIFQLLPYADLWQRMYPDKIVSYKVHCVGQSVLPKAAIVCFHGVPKPHDLLPGDSLREAWEVGSVLVT